MENEQVYKNGLAPDPRSEEEKAKDYRQPEGALTLNWIEKPKEQWKRYTPREQDYSLSCMAQAGVKAMETLNLTVMSAHPPYRSRANYSEGGMWPQNLGDVLKNIGTTTEVLDKSQGINEAQMNRSITVPTPTKIAQYWFVNFHSIDSMAEAVELHKHCVLVIHCYKTEWTSIPQLNGKDGKDYDFGHGICAVDWTMYNGEKALIIEDSTGHFNSLPPEREGKRILTESFLKSRCVAALYFTIDTSLPPFKFTQTLRQGSRGEVVKKLQEFLNKQGAILNVDGIFGFKTFIAVRIFQSLNGLIPDGIVGPKTITKINLII